MDVTIFPSKDLFGSVQIPSSKSQTLRALFSALLAKGLSCIENALDSEDTLSMIHVLEAFGAKVTFSKNKIFVLSKGLKNLKRPKALDVKSSGITLRFISALCALMKHRVTVSGSLSLQKQRSVKELENGLKTLGAKVFSSSGFCPMTICGPIQKNKTFIIGKDSQPVSGLLWIMSLSKKPSRLHVFKADEKPWVNLTLSWIRAQNKKVFNKKFHTYFLKGKPRVSPFNYRVPGDFSSASFILAAGILAGKQVRLDGLKMDDLQGDKAVFYLLKKAGAQIDFFDEAVVCKQSERINLSTIDCSSFIDALPVLAALSCFSSSPCSIENAQGARGKESDRIHAMRSNLEILNLKVEENPDSLTIYPQTPQGGILEGFNDHRIIMACSILGLKSTKPVKIKGAHEVKKTYPNFFKDLETLGAKVLWG